MRNATGVNILVSLGLTELKLFQRELVTPKMQGSAGVDVPKFCLIASANAQTQRN